MRRHQASIHDINVTWYVCEKKGCTYIGKNPTRLRDHTKRMHGERSKDVKCDVQGCKYKCTSSRLLKLHMLHTHDIGVNVWYTCNKFECGYRCRTMSNLRVHMSGKNTQKNMEAIWSLLWNLSIIKCSVLLCKYIRTSTCTSYITAIKKFKLFCR